jgi:hypothetical protein
MGNYFLGQASGQPKFRLHYGMISATRFPKKKGIDFQIPKDFWLGAIELIVVSY